jgi:polysaccharide pyruvyl transferase CsaB
VKNRAFITGYYGFGNTGDEAILAAMVAHLRALRPGLKITVTSAVPKQTADLHNVDAILWSDALAMLEAVRNAGVVLIGGGGIFHDYWGFNPNAFLTDNHAGISFYTAPAVLGALYQKPVMLYAVGVGPLLSEYARKFTKVASDAAQVITVRDAASKDLLESIGIPSTKISITADPAFGFEHDASEPADLNDLPKPVIAVAVRNWNVGVSEAFWEEEVSTGLDLFLGEQEGSIVFVPFQSLTGGLEDDAAIADRIRSRIKQQDRTRVLEAAASPTHLFSVLNACDLVIGMRLHSLIFALLGSTPVIALSYDEKVNQVMERTGLADFSIDIKAVEAQKLAEAMIATLSKGDSIRQSVKPRVHELASLARTNAQEALNLLDRGAQPRSLDAETAMLLVRGMQAQLRDSHALRIESVRLHKEIQFYLDESKRATDLQHQLSAAEETRQALSTKIAEIEAQQPNTLREVAARNAAVEELSSRIASLDKERRHLHNQNKALTAKVNRLESEAIECSIHEKAELTRQTETLNAVNTAAFDTIRKAEDIRQKTVTSLDRYQNTFNEVLQEYRNQRAWQVMLCFRKAYTLLFRSGWSGRFHFLKWVFGAPFAGMGKLADYDLKFPSVWNYAPERLEAPFVTGASVTTKRPDASNELVAPAKLANILPQRKYDVVIMAIFDFDFRFQRPQQIAAEFARRGHRVFWVSPGRYLSTGSADAIECLPLRENLWEVHLRGKRPELYTGQLTPEEADRFRASLEELYREFTIAESCVVLQFPYWRQVGLKLREQFDARVLYDCMDDWQNWTAEPRISQFNLDEEKRLIAESDVLVVTSQEFTARHTTPGIKPVLARNAADFDFFSSPRPNNLLASIPRPIIGYYGAIADWFDLDLVYQLAKSRPQYSFVLIGQVHAVDTTQLQQLPNVHMLGEKNYREIPLYLSHFTVCLIPFILNKLTKGVDPVKMYEYFSQGKPVVATDMAELAQSTGLLYIGKDLKDFTAKVDAAVQESDPALQQRRISFAASNTWANRVDAIDTAIQGTYPLISILLITYNCEEFLEPCLDAVQRNTAWPNYEIVVVDNNSTDGTRTILNRYAGSDPRIHLYLSSENHGFGGGNNIAARMAQGEYLVFLNPDTIVSPGWLARMLRHCKRDRSIGSVAAVTNFSGNETKVNVDYINVLEMEEFALTLAAEKAGECMDIAVAPLYCVLIPRSVWNQVGELDQEFQVGMFEDDDLSLRIRKAGYRVIAADDCFIHHFGNGSFAKLPSQDSLRIFEQNKKRYEQKWGVSWKAHSVRPGVRPPYEEHRFTPADFLRVKQTSKDQGALVQLHDVQPSTCTAHKGFNVQPNGQSALVVRCDNATPGTVVVMGGTMLTTAYANPRMLTALVPPELLAQVDVLPVYLLNDFGESNRVDFTVVNAQSVTNAHSAP